MRTLKELAQDAMDVQDACNLRGVTKGFARALDDLHDTLLHEKLDASTMSLRLHPIAQLWASKCHDLCGMGLSDMDAFGKAYEACKELTGRRE